MAEPQEKRESAPESLGKPLDRSAKAALKKIVAELRTLLLVEAGRTSSRDQITDDDLHEAYKRLGWPSTDSLAFADAQAVISQALRENRAFEWISYGMATVLFLFGLVLLGAGATAADVATRVGALCSGSVVELLILIPFRFVVNSRRQNIALRMLGLILNRVDDPKKSGPAPQRHLSCRCPRQSTVQGGGVNGMLDWLRRIDDAVFGPPHRFETVLAFVVLRLGLAFEEAGESTGQEELSRQPTPSGSQ